MLKGAGSVIGMRSLMEDIGVYVSAHVNTDSSAAKGIASRRGLGKTRHIDVCYLWLQEKTNNKDIYIHKVPGERNPADMMTKYLPANRMGELMEYMAIKYDDGRHQLAPKMATGTAPEL